MDAKKIFDIINFERKMNFKSKTEISDFLGFNNPQSFNIFMRRLKNNNSTNRVNALFKRLEKLGYEISINKK